MLTIAQTCRVLVDNDWAGDPDGLLALAHHLLSPANRVVGVTSSFLNPVFGPSAGTAQRGADLAHELLELTGHDLNVVDVGLDAPFDGTLRASAAADAIVAAAESPDPLPLVVVCAGPLTNVADALRRAPHIAERLVLAWVGGSIAENTPEYNLDTDPAAAEFVFAASALSITQFPLETYRRLGYSLAALELDLSRTGPLGAWLWERFVTLPLPDFVSIGAVWALGDSAPLVVTALNDESAAFEEVAGSPARRLCTDLDARVLFDDLLARLTMHSAAAPQR